MSINNKLFFKPNSEMNNYNHFSDILSEEKHYKFQVPPQQRIEEIYKGKDYRYYKLIVHENVSKNWNNPHAAGNNNEGYFSHLDDSNFIPNENPNNAHNNMSSKVLLKNLSGMVEDSDSSADFSYPIHEKISVKNNQGQYSPTPAGGNGNSNRMQNPVVKVKDYAMNGTVDNTNNHHHHHQQNPASRMSRKTSNSSNTGYNVTPVGGGYNTGSLKRSSNTSVEYLESLVDSEENGSPSIPGSENEKLNKSPSGEDVFFHIIEHPLKHQVKEFNILPAGVLQLMNHYQSSPSDYIIVKLLCDPKMDKEQIFLTAVSTHYSQTNSEITIPSLKVSQKMLPGRTKGYAFRLLYELFVSGKIVQKAVTDEFFIWSNVNQKGYPRKERDAFLSQRIESNKKKIKPKRKTPGRPRKNDNDEIEFDDTMPACEDPYV